MTQGPHTLHAYFFNCEYYPLFYATSSKAKPFKDHIIGEAVSPQHMHGDSLNQSPV